MHQNGHSPPIPVHDCDLFKHLPDRKHQWHPRTLPRGAFASISQETDLQTRHRIPLRHLLIVPRRSWARRNLTRVSRRPQPILSPILLLYLWNKNKLHLHLWSTHYSSLSPALSHKKEKQQQHLQTPFITSDRAKHLAAFSLPGLQALFGSSCLHSSLVAKNLSSPRLASPTSCPSVGVEVPRPRLGLLGQCHRGTVHW